MHVEYSCPCGANGTRIVGDEEWADDAATVRCPDCGDTLSQPGNHLQRIRPSLPVSVCFLAHTGLGPQGRVLAVSRKDDHAAFGLPGGKVDPDDGPLEAEHFLATVQRTVAREVREETGVDLDPLGFRIVHQGVCPGGADGRAFWQVILTYHHDDDWVAVTQPGEGVVAWVTWARLAAGPFGHFNRKLHAALWEQMDPLTAPIEDVDESIRMHGGDPEAIGQRGADLVRDLIRRERGDS